MINLKNFRTVAFLEGLSYILLLFIATPIKHLFNQPLGVRLLGMPHGLLFVAYILMAFLLKDEQKWNNKTLFIILIASILPFGTFYVDFKYLKKQQ